MSHLHAPDSLLICPYDKNHKIQAYKMQAHMVKCKKSHPELDKALETCPFNALHKYLGCDKDKHIKACPDKERVIRAVQDDPGLICSRSHVKEIRPSEKVVNNDDEDWDDEVEVKKPIIKLENTTREEKIDKKVPSPTKYEPSPKKDALPQKSPIKKEPTETDDSSKNATVPDISEQKKSPDENVKRLEQESRKRYDDDDDDKPRSFSIGRGIRRACNDDQRSKRLKRDN